ncbi:MAG: endo alpha-1,4 polygalactosaminidase [Methylococcales bacterium]|nr:endo alpha-1,4 polygalactosaminidase [Methylococcales bacterium]
MTHHKSLILPVIIVSLLFSHSAIAKKDYRQSMRDFVISLSKDAKKHRPNFIIIPQNGQELITSTGDANGKLQTEYLNAIDATGRESMFYGYHQDNQKTPVEEREFLRKLSLLNKNNNVPVLATDYCASKTKMDDSYTINQKNGFISFAAPKRNLTVIPNYPAKIHNENTSDITQISQAKNFLYLINGDAYPSKATFIKAVVKTNYDVIIMDLFHNEQVFTQKDINRLKIKDNGGKRLLIAYMSIGEAEDYRYYWQKKWRSHKPKWLEAENPDWAGNYKVKYWGSGWQSIIFGHKNSYLNKIISAGFDGAYLDIIDGFEYFEEQ